ncbi:MAG: M15 family metallopeptidase [Oscillospiraceae bacterium]|nr:M15 family metallopeptidase [Oscillospiraceae bacterium]
MRSRLRFWKYPIFIISLLLVVAAFTLVYTLSEIAVAPYEKIETPDIEVIDTPKIPDDEPEDEPSDDPGDELPEKSPEIKTDPALEMKHNPAVDGYITIEIDESEISRGTLLLVNQDHAFELPAQLDLVNIVTEKTVPFRVLGQNYLLSRSIIEPLDAMMEAYIAAARSNTVAIISGFRNYDTQQGILNSYIRRVGQREALRWAARPGHSEHHTGIAFDFGVYVGGSRGTFTGVGVTSWFRRNSYNYGFILRYPPNKSHITRTSHEPWHFRYVGLPHSAIMFQNNWVLEEYLEMLRDHTFEEPFEAENDGIIYEIYFTTETEIKLPINSEFEISGNNVDGFIVTTNRLEYDPDKEVEFSV